ncbi:Sarcosine oxidase subunit alpha [Beijerinckiaceae bacterium RH AL1]|nr:Sarcosine oxidase subunit alpha [Beijerinckiaceae bacterium RH AL1]
MIDDIDLSPEAFPHMAMRLGHIHGVPCRLFRVSFTGEAGYEINVPADYGRAIWEAVMAAGQPYGITPYGTETMHVLRAEKGFIIVGQETDGTVTPDDLGLGGMIAKSKVDFVGKRSLARVDLVAAGRKQLVGFQTDDPKLVLDEGAQVVVSDKGAIPMPMLGHVTSSYWSANCGRSIAMALVADGRRRLGDTLYVTTMQGFAEVKVVEPVFFDAKGERIHA